MNTKIKRIVAIIGSVFMITGAILLLFLCFDTTNEKLSLLAMLFSGLGLASYLVILAFKGFPLQQIKEEERRKIEEEYYKSLQKSDVEAESESTESESTESENESESAESESAK